MNGMTISHFEFVKSKFQSSHTSSQFIDFDNPINHFLIRGMAFLSHQDWFLMVSALVYVIHWIRSVNHEARL